MLVSIVITNYNKGKYLPFLFKILELTLQPEGEIIVIDDGSTQQFDLDFLKKSQFQIYYNRINKGIGYVRNYALTLCKGKYIAFIDGDDFISTDYILTVLELAKLDYDIIHFPSMEYSLNPNVYLEFDMYQLWSCLYNLEFIKKYNIHFNTASRISEDYYFNKRLLRYNPRIYNYTNHLPIYFYNLYSENGLTH